MPINRVAKTVTAIVAINTPLKSIPVLFMSAGLTITMYIIVTKVVMPAMISVDRVVPLSLNLKNLFSTKYPPTVELHSG